MRIRKIFLTLSVLVFSCSSEDSLDSDNSSIEQIKVKKLHFEVVSSSDHDSSIFTQGFEIDGDIIFESGGGYGTSIILAQDKLTKETLYKKNIEKQYFAEGLTVVDDKIYLLTWKSQKGFILDKSDFSIVESFTYNTQGWGLAYDSDEDTLIVSDGSDSLYFIDRISFEVKKVLKVKDENYNPVGLLNELEFVKGKIFANIWHQDDIVVISPDTGLVEGVCDLSSLLDVEIRNSLDSEAVLNGIAYDHQSETFFVTGKNWPKVFEIRLTNF
jgi:glutaminyl-peptide cyclotransferase